MLMALWSTVADTAAVPSFERKKGHEYMGALHLNLANVKNTGRHFPHLRLLSAVLLRPPLLILNQEEAKDCPRCR
jgi:hypothetical protein